MLKPSQMGVVGAKNSISLHKKKVIAKLTSLSKTKTRQKLVADVCLKIMETPNGGTVDISKLQPAEIGEIKNYFAEVMGPIWAQEAGLIPGLKASDSTYFSTSDTERLFDFKVYKGKEEILVSNKQKTGGTNTLKPGDVVRLVRENRHLSDKWSNTKYYKIFDILDKSNVVSGPIKAIAKYYPKLTGVNPGDYTTVINQLNQNDVVLDEVPKSIMKLIMADPTAAKKYEDTEKVTGTMINFIFEKLLVQQSEQDPNYHELFVDVTEGNVLFLKFDLSNKGKISFLIENPRKAEKRAKLRSKQGVERRSSSGKLKLDKLGFQP
jgi:hypothetical protein